VPPVGLVTVVLTTMPSSSRVTVVRGEFAAVVSGRVTEVVVTPFPFSRVVRSTPVVLSKTLRSMVPSSNSRVVVVVDVNTSLPALRVSPSVSRVVTSSSVVILVVTRSVPPSVAATHAPAALTMPIIGVPPAAPMPAAM